jgi:hypothetical protein
MLFGSIIRLEKSSKICSMDLRESVRLRERSSKKSQNNLSKNAIENKIERARKIYDLFSNITNLQVELGRKSENRIAKKLGLKY